MNLNQKSAIIIGSVSGVTPIAVNLISVDAALIFNNFQLETFLGYLVQGFLLMSLGGFIVYVNAETKPWKAFQLGIMAPAIIVGILNGNKVQEMEDALAAVQAQEQAQVDLKVDPIITDSLLSFSFFSQAHAADKKKWLNQPSSAQRFWIGFTGKMSDSWFVITGAHKTKKAAELQAKEIKKKGFAVKVYDPFKGKSKFSVVIGSYLSLRDAQSLRKKAVAEGLPKSTHIWRWQP